MPSTMLDPKSGSEEGFDVARPDVKTRPYFKARVEGRVRNRVHEKPEKDRNSRSSSLDGAL